jgi:hypothetical protein
VHVRPLRAQLLLAALPGPARVPVLEPSADGLVVADAADGAPPCICLQQKDSEE